MLIGYGRSGMISPVVTLLMRIVIILALLGFIQEVSSAPVPGVKTGALEVWENSALPGIFASAFSTQYLDFRAYALTVLSDAGLLDHLIDDLQTASSTALREVDDIGFATGIVVTLLGAAAAARGRRRGAGSSTDTEAEEIPDTHGATMDNIKSTAKSLVRKLLRNGPIAILMQQCCKDNNNVLNLFRTLDERYVPIDPAAKAEALTAYHVFKWDIKYDFWTNLGLFDARIQLLRTVGFTGSEIPTYSSIPNAGRLSN
jgi:hypothetical protein